MCRSLDQLWQSRARLRRGSMRADETWITDRDGAECPIIFERVDHLHEPFRCEAQARARLVRLRLAGDEHLDLGAADVDDQARRWISPSRSWRFPPARYRQRQH